MASGRTAISSTTGRYLLLYELDGHWRGAIDDLARRLEASATCVDAEHYEIVRFLVRSQQIASGRINGESARRFPMGWCVFEGTKLPVAADRKNSDGVTAAVRRVEKLAGGRYGNLRRIIVTFVLGRQARNGLQFVQ